jgi:hypothetical protein
MATGNGVPLELQGVLNLLAGTTGMGEDGAACVWAGVTGVTMLRALNIKNGTLEHSFNRVCNQLASTSGYSGVGALNHLAGNPL